MRAPTADERRQIEGLALAGIDAFDPMLTVRAARVYTKLASVGCHVPLFVVRDLVSLATLPDAPERLRVTADARGSTVSDAFEERAEDLRSYVAMLGEVADSEAFARARALKLGDDVLTVLVHRAVARVFLERTAHAPAALPLDARFYVVRRVDDTRDGAGDRAGVAELRALVGARARVLAAVDQIDADVLTLLGMIGAESANDALGLVDLFAAFEAPEAQEIARFSLDLLPSVLEPRRGGGRQRLGVDGYAGVETGGALESLVLSELAYDDDVFARRFLDRDLLHWVRDKRHDEERRAHYVAIDASASMRGRRSTFSRGLALALVKRLTLLGEDVTVRFFDARLYEPMRIRRGPRAVGLDLPRLLSFRGERGRHYAKVFALLADDLSALRARERVAPTVHLLTHAECHVPEAIVARLAAKARLRGVFFLPDGEALDLEWLGHLERVDIVGEDALEGGERRVRRARDIAEASADVGRPVPAGPSAHEGA